MNRLGTIQIESEISLSTTGVAISGSELIASVTRQARVAQASGNPRKAIQTGLQHLEGRGLVNAQERQTLSRMCDLAMIPTASAKRKLANAQRLRSLHDGLVVSMSGPVAIAIAGAIVQHFASNESATTAALKFGPNAAAGFLGAAIVGGVLGGLAGGPGGALIGVVGGVIGAMTNCSAD